MKKFIVLLAVILGVSISASAQQGVCRVSNGDGATVVVTVESISEDGTVWLDISSDCQDVVNVSFTVTYRLAKKGSDTWWEEETSRIYNVLAQPRSTTTKKISVNVADYRLHSVYSVNISGARCE